MTDPVAACLEALADFGREPGRAAWLEVRTEQATWSGGRDADEGFPAASLLKLPLAMTAEAALRNAGTQHSVVVADLLDPADVSVLWSLMPDHRLDVVEIMRLMLATSDNACARYLLDRTTIADIAGTIAAAGCTATDVTVLEDEHSHPTLAGTTTARDAVALLKAACDAARYPVTAFALTHSVRNSRIPLGATGEDVIVAHKTGTLRGVAHDVAIIRGDGGELLAAFLTDEQHDLLVTGYEMGICTRRVLQAWEISARQTTSAVAQP